MFELDEKQAWELHRKGELSLAQYMSVRDSVKAQEQKILDAKLTEETALAVERAIVEFGGVKVQRQYGQVPNPFAAKTKNLSNSMAVIRAAQSGNSRAIELAKYLHEKAGLVSPDYLEKLQQRQLDKAREADRLRSLTTAMAQANDQRLNRSRGEAFPEANEQMRQRSVHNIPYFGAGA